MSVGADDGRCEPSYGQIRMERREKKDQSFLRCEENIISYLFAELTYPLILLKIASYVSCHVRLGLTSLTERCWASVGTTSISYTYYCHLAACFMSSSEKTNLIKGSYWHSYIKVAIVGNGSTSATKGIKFCKDMLGLECSYSLNA